MQTQTAKVNPVSRVDRIIKFLKKSYWTSPDEGGVRWDPDCIDLCVGLGQQPVCWHRLRLSLFDQSVSTCQELSGTGYGTLLRRFSPKTSISKDSKKPFKSLAHFPSQRPTPPSPSSPTWALTSPSTINASGRLFLISTPMSGQGPETSRLCDDSVADEGNSWPVRRNVDGDLFLVNILTQLWQQQWPRGLGMWGM